MRQGRQTGDNERHHRYHGRHHLDAEPWFENRSGASLKPEKSTRHEKGWLRDDEQMQGYVPARYTDGPWERVDTTRQHQQIDPGQTPIGKYPREVLEEGTHGGKGSRHYNRPDYAIYEDLCKRLTNDPTIDASEIEVFVKEGIVYLDGQVDSRYTRELVEEIAERIQGVQIVESTVRVPRNSSGGGEATGSQGKKKYLHDDYT